jgi:flagellar assembly protein FliH
MKDRDRLETEYYIQIEASRAQKMSELETLKQQTLLEARLEGAKVSKEEVYQKFSDLIELIESVKEELEAKKKTWIAEVESDIVKLSLVIAEKLVQQELTTHPEMLLKMIKALLKETSEQTSLTIQTNPEDLALIKSHLPELKQTLGSVKAFNAEPNPNIKRGGVIFDMDSGILDARIETQIGKLYKALVNEPN